jgi:lipopolysaccharide/colanic/teichoic acid biosynthesis glycosyltransferase
LDIWARLRTPQRDALQPLRRGRTLPDGALKLQRAVKLVADPILALIGLVLLSPFFLVVAALIVIESGRPVCFVHPRAGKTGRSFRMFKFRTMVQDAIQLGREAGLSEDPFGVIMDDPRVTRIGRWLRRTGLDELPQLGNVLLGQMSLVGPRADLVEQAANYAPRERRRLDVLPGITGWAQIHGRDSVSWPERFELDLWYLDHWSLWLDFKIMLGTFREVFRAEPNPVEDTMNIERAKAAEREG